MPAATGLTDEMRADQDDGATLTHHPWPGFGREQAIFVNGELVAVAGESDSVRIYDGDEGTFDEYDE